MTHVIAEPRAEGYPADCVCEGQRMHPLGRVRRLLSRYARLRRSITEMACPAAGRCTLAGLIPALRADVDGGCVLRRTR
jgi:hypothetical protein